MGQVDDASANDAGSSLTQDGKPGSGLSGGEGDGGASQDTRPADASVEASAGGDNDAPQAEGTVLWSIANRGESTRGGTAVPGGTGSPERSKFFTTETVTFTKNPRSPRPNQHDFFYLQPSSAVWLSHCLCS